MPPSRRKASNPTTRAQQTLAFGPNSNKVTKPSVSSQHKKSTKASQDELSKSVAAELSTPEPEAKEQEPEAQIQSPRTLAIRKQAPAPQTEGSEVEQQAGKIPDTHLRKYWMGKEEERIAPRVHQQGLSVNEKILRHFDLSSQYGVCLDSSWRFQCPASPRLPGLY